MPKPIKSLVSYVRTQAAACLGLTPYADIDTTRAAVCAQLNLANTADVFALAPDDRDADGDDPIADRKVAAAKLLLTDVDDPRHSRRMVRFSAADSRVQEAQKVFQIKSSDPADADAQLTLV